MSQEHEVSKMVGVYKKLFLILVVITAIGIAVTFLHLPIVPAVVIAFAIMAVKSKVVIDSFKSLLAGKMSLVILFGLTISFVLGLLLLPIMNNHGSLVGTIDTSKQLLEEQPQMEEGHEHGH